MYIAEYYSATSSERSQQAFYVPMPIDPHPRSIVWLVRAQDEVVRILFAPVEQRPHRVFLYHDPLGNLRDTLARDAVGEEEPVRHEAADRRRHGHERLRRYEDGQAAVVVARDVATEAVA